MATKIAHAYPGQGAQFPEMGKYLSRKALQIATESFQKLITALEKQDKEILTETEFVQPAVYLVEASLMEKLPSPSLVLGIAQENMQPWWKPEFGMFELDLKS